MPLAASSPILALTAAATVAGAATVGMLMARGSTAVPAAAWGVAAAAAFAAESLLNAWDRGGDPATAACARLVVVSLSLCPILALLGAKRPQHGVWQFIVAALAAVLAMPAASAVLVRPGSSPDVHPLERWLVLVLTLAAGINFLATRHAVAAWLVVGGQLLLARSVLPFGTAGAAPGMTDTLAAWLVAGGAVLAMVQSWAWPIRTRERAARGDHPEATAAIDAWFLPLRETLGSAWMLRIRERFNAEAAARGWPCRLEYDGLHVADRHRCHAWQADAVRMARSLVRRFVSPEWLAGHGADRRKR